MNKQALVVALTFALTFGEVLAFDQNEQAVIDAQQQQIVALQAQLAQLQSSDLAPEDVVTLSWLVVACLAVGAGIKNLKGML